VYNIGTGESFSVNEIAIQICETIKQYKNIFPAIEHVADRPGHDFRYAVDSSKINSELSWIPEVDFKTGLQETIKWYIERPTDYNFERLGI
jgi:dTDP-glucose 4,6-dehydratase